MFVHRASVILLTVLSAEVLWGQEVGYGALRGKSSIEYFQGSRCSRIPRGKKTVTCVYLNIHTFKGNIIICKIVKSVGDSLKANNASVEMRYQVQVEYTQAVTSTIGSLTRYGVIGRSSRVKFGLYMGWWWNMLYFLFKN